MKCSLVDNGIFINPQGIVTACCVSMQDPFGDCNEQSIAEIWNGPVATKFRKDFHKGNLPISCHECINLNNFAIRKHKTQKIDNLKQENDTIVHADITLGNICQLSCTMCGPTFSHTWAKIKNQPNRVWHMSETQIDDLLENLQTVKDIEIKGGDPFNMPHFDYFIDKIVSINPEVNLTTLTSGVYMSDHHIEKLKKLENFQLGISVEATGELYKYIRGGSHSFDTVVDNLKKAKDKGLIKDFLHISSTLSLYNITSWTKQHIEIVSTLKQKVGIKDIKLSLNLVEDPQNQSVYAAKQEIRENWIKQNNNLKLINTKDYLHILDDRKLSITPKEIMHNIHYNDMRRGMLLEQIVPEIYSIIG
jgi:MoaA/NifB/PqqE/SkfB family radical SAM enzyme